MKKLKYVFCDDWLIFAIDKQKRLYYVNTEMWPEWLDIPEKQQWQANAVRKYMLPIARKDWNNFYWRPAELADGKQEVFSYLKHYRTLASIYLWYRPRYILKSFIKRLIRS